MPRSRTTCKRYLGSAGLSITPTSFETQSSQGPGGSPLCPIALPSRGPKVPLGKPRPPTDPNLQSGLAVRERSGEIAKPLHGKSRDWPANHGLEYRDARPSTYSAQLAEWNAARSQDAPPNDGVGINF